MARPRINSTVILDAIEVLKDMSEGEQKLALARILDPSQDDTERITGLLEECERAGIDVKDIRHYWYKSENYSINVKNTGKTYEQVRDEIIAEMDEYAPVYPTIYRKPLEGGNLLVIDPSDIHVGKLAVAVETGEDYNIEKAVKRVDEGIKHLISMSEGFPIDQILFVIGNDALHIDTPKRTTTAGTHQDTDGMWHSAFHAAKNMYISAIERLVPLADVHVLYCPSNHDYTHGFFLADTLSSWFRNAENVTFDVSIRHRKYYKYHGNMIEADHGDGCKEAETPMLMATEQPVMWSECNFRYSYKHHIHHNKSKDYTGVNITYLRTPSPSDSWHDRNGYKNMPAIEAFVHSKDNGRFAHFTHYY